MNRPARIAALALATLSACAPPADAPVDPNVLPLRGTAPFSPLEKVDFVLARTDGTPYDFRRETDGKIALLFFGYTYCPDICPIHMATLARAMADLEPEVRARVEVVFVTVDPERDTAERLAAWLGAFDEGFVGLRGTLDEVSAALAFYRYPRPETSGEPVGYTVGHPALIYAFTPDNLGRALYGVETTRAAWVHDLNLMARHRWGSATPTVLGAVAPAPPAGSSTGLYATLVNPGDAPDTLLGLTSDAAASGALHRMEEADGMMRMTPVPEGVPLLPGDTVRLAPGGLHGMLTGLRRELVVGETILVSFTFAKAGVIPTPVRVIEYADVPRAH